MSRSYMAARWGGDSFRWLGYRLHRVRVADVAALLYLESPLIMGGDISPLDYLVAAHICESSSAEVRARRTVGSLGLWQSFRLKLASYRLGRSYEGSSSALQRFFEEWWLAETSGPQVLCAEGKPMMSPWLDVLEARLLRMGYQSQEIAEMPLSLALWKQLTGQELKGAEFGILDEKLRAKFRAAGYDDEEISNMKGGHL